MNNETLVVENEAPESAAEQMPWWSDRAAPFAYTTQPQSGELIGAVLADPSPLEPGVWLVPANAYLDVPPAAVHGMAIVRSGAAWIQVEDYRGTTVYSTQTGEPQEWQELGPLSMTVTTTAPASEFDTWENGQWMLDEAAQKAAQIDAATRKRSLLLQYASTKVNALQDAVDLEMATEVEVAALKTWKTYRVLLNRVDTVGAVPAETDWPASPDPAATTGYLSAQGYQEATPAA